MFKIFLLFFIFFHFFVISDSRSFGRGEKEWYERRRLKASCLQRKSWFSGKSETPEDQMSFRQCWYWEGLKSWWRRNSIKFSPGKTKNWNLTELYTHCHNYFTCMDNTKCYKDFVLYETLDRCQNDVFNIGPMSFCTQKLQEIHEKQPDKLSYCAKENLKNPPLMYNLTFCDNIQKFTNCFQPEVEKHCDPYIVPLFKEHQRLRLYNLGCDGQLKFQDMDNSTASD